MVVFKTAVEFCTHHFGVVLLAALHMNTKARTEMRTHTLNLVWCDSIVSLNSVLSSENT